jgi:hypothetical protein
MINRCLPSHDGLGSAIKNTSTPLSSENSTGTDPTCRKRCAIQHLFARKKGEVVWVGRDHVDVAGKEWDGNVP